MTPGLTSRGMAQLPTPTQLHEKLKSNQSGSDIHVWFPSSEKQEYIYLEEMNPWSKPKLSETCSLSKQITQATKTDPWMLPQASLVASSDLRVGTRATNPHLPQCTKIIFYKMLGTHTLHTVTSCLPCYHLHNYYDSVFREFQRFVYTLSS